jgi:protein gp37
MRDTLIEWCDSTVNPTGFQCQGCELWRPVQGVKDCYAGQFAERIGGVGAFDRPVELRPGRMSEAALWADLREKARPNKPWIPPEYPRIIFIGDMADTFQRGVPFEYLFDEVIGNVTSEHGLRHVWMWLTKDAKQLVKFSLWLESEKGWAWPENLWPGVSITSQQTTWRIDLLLRVPAARRFISYEPAWEWVDFNPWFYNRSGPMGFRGDIHQVIIGGESGRGAKDHPFNVEWARRLIEDCEDARVACFVKQMGRRPIWLRSAGDSHHQPLLLKSSKGGDWSEWPKEFRVRQFPELT